MPRYEITLKLTLDAGTQAEAAELADDFAGWVEDAEGLLPPGDSSLRPVAVSWPLEVENRDGLTIINEHGDGPTIVMPQVPRTPDEEDKPF